MTSVLVLILDADHNLEQLSWPPAVPELSFAQAPGPGASHCRILGKWHDLQKPVLTSHSEEWASPYDSLTWEIFTMLSIPQIHSLLGTQHQQGAVHAIPIWLQSRAVVTFQTVGFHPCSCSLSLPHCCLVSHRGEGYGLPVDHLGRLSCTDHNGRLVEVAAELMSVTASTPGCFSAVVVMTSVGGQWAF